MQCSGSQHPSSLLVKGAGHARLSALPAPWCHAFVAMGVVCHHVLCLVCEVYSFFHHLLVYPLHD